MTCARIRALLPGYLDGSIPKSAQHAQVVRHAVECQNCREELERYRKLSYLMSRIDRVSPPPDLAIRIHVAVAQAREEAGFANQTRKWRNRAELVLKNILEPLALPVTGGVVVALVVFSVVIQVLGVTVPLRAIAGDSPTNLLQPASVESLAPFPVTGLNDGSTGGAHLLLVDAIVGTDGKAASYQILAGPNNESVRRQLDQVMLFSRFRPELSFGRPTSGGHVILSFSEIRVRG